MSLANAAFGYQQSAVEPRRKHWLRAFLRPRFRPVQCCGKDNFCILYE